MAPPLIMYNKFGLTNWITQPNGENWLQIGQWPATISSSAVAIVGKLGGESVTNLVNDQPFTVLKAYKLVVTINNLFDNLMIRQTFLPPNFPAI